VPGKRRRGRYRAQALRVPLRAAGDPRLTGFFENVCIGRQPDGWRFHMTNAWQEKNFLHPDEPGVLVTLHFAKIP
ncbi:hypothetical protein, partial [Burkholderia sp.]|uniref:hypothetical protein n=1 Tax=Burkholderia sp. TaxID=36773 RepID=UPI002586C54B